MYRLSHKALGLATTLLIVVASSTARADDTEIFFTETKSGGDANLMLILDTSGSMGDTATSSPQPYDSTLSYSLKGTGSGKNDTGACQKGRVYYRPNDPLNTTAPTSCVGLSYITYDTANPSQTDNKCKASQSALNYGSGYAGRAGFYQDRFIRWGGTKNNRSWNATLDVENSPASVECLADAGNDGNLTSSNPYPRPGPTNDSSGRWGSAAQQWWSATNVGKEYILWSANYIAYSKAPPATTQTRMEVVKEAATNLLSELTDMNVGLMRYDAAGHGGMVLAPARPIDDGTNRADLIALVNDLKEGGFTPLTETLFEAYRYFSSGPVGYGNNSKACSVSSNGTCPAGSQVNSKSVAASRFPATLTGENYDSPADASCQNNYIVFLTDGLPNSDTESDTDIDKLAGTTCDAEGPPRVGTSDSTGRCLSALTKHMYEYDLRGSVEGIQNIKTYFIGFGDDFAGGLSVAFDYLTKAAELGGGKAFQANSMSQLEGAFNSIVSDVVDTNTTFTSPTVAVNAFNRTQTLSDLYVSVFQPSLNRHWPGNLKKYSVNNGIIRDQNDNAAVDPNTGFFKPSARSLWSSVTDGYDVAKGGAASLLPGPSSRKVYTYIGANPTTGMANLTSGNTFGTSNTDLTDTLLGIGGSGDPTREDLINWALGQDVRDVDPINGNNTETRHVMGDPIHAQPAVVIYGGTTTTPNLDDAMIYLPTNDGFLHAIDTVTGEEQWAFIPQEVIPQLKGLYQNQTTTTKQYALDGEIRVLKYDVNADGIVDPDAGDRVILYFGQGRGGSTYYALDVTSKTTPKFMWSLGPSVLTGIGQAWSTPVVARVNINGATQNSQKLVLVVGGGYDAGEDGAFYVISAASGNRVYMIDAIKGTLLWSAGHASSNANLKLDRMEHSIPSHITVMDTDQDGYADRMYVGDMAAQLWRFDITNGNPASSLVTGGVIASLGTRDDSTHTEEDARRFYSAPDVAAIRLPGHLPFFSIAIGSGYRGHPLNKVNQDRFYALRDLKPFTVMTQAQYNSLTPIKDADLQDITTDVTPTVPADSVGWKLLLNQPGGTWQGEKVLSAASTFDNRIFFTTYRPSLSTTNACTSNSAGTGSNRAYVVNAFDGSPVPPQHDSGTGDDGETGNGGNGDDELSPEDRYMDLRQGGIAPEISFLFPEPNKIVCLSGVEVLSACTNFNSRVKTYWRDSNAN